MQRKNLSSTDGLLDAHTAVLQLPAHSCGTRWHHIYCSTTVLDSLDSC